MTRNVATDGNRSGRSRVLTILAAAISSGVTIFLLATLHDRTNLAALVPSFGATCALVFAHPDSPFSRPLNVVGGHLISSAAGLLTLIVLGFGPLAFGVGVGLAIGAMMATRTMHPPAGGDPLIVMLIGAPVSFLVEPILLGTIAIVAGAFAVRSIQQGLLHGSLKLKGRI